MIETAAQEETLNALGYEAFMIVRSKNDDDAVVRLQSDPIFRALMKIPSAHVTFYRPDPLVQLVIDRPTCVIFHYHDIPAISCIQAMAKRAKNITVICLGSDIYAYARYTILHDFVDLFIMPSEIHRKILAHQVYKPVYVMPECIDPIAALETGAAGDFPVKKARRVLWFGYSESFYKSMASLMPVIMLNLKNKKIDDFAIIVDEANFNKSYGNEFGIRTIAYDNATFRHHAENFDYVILSHFPLDLTLNSYIKSPNKVITALLAGLIPIASDTPNYRAFFELHGLQKFLFSSARELHEILNGLDPQADAAFVQNTGVIPWLLENGSEAKVFENFLKILEDFNRKNDHDVDRLAMGAYVEPKRTVNLGEHLKDLAPSVLRAWRNRMQRRRRLD